MSYSEGQRPQTDKEWKLLEKVVMSVQEENRKQRRWMSFFRLLTFAYLFFLLFLFMPQRLGLQTSTTGEHVAVVEVLGIISADSEASADLLITGLRRAFEADSAKAVVLRINSPGGSPVQSAYVYNEIRRLRELHPEKPLYAVITDTGASGAYYIAAAADEIYANESSLVGSIGVIMGSFGFVDAIDKLGIERRVMTAGNNKALLDPFKPVDPQEQKHVQQMLDEVHEQFIVAVKEGRGERLKYQEYPEVFSGLFWSGVQAKELGIIDGFASTGQLARDVVGVEEIVDYTPRRDPFSELFGRFGVKVGEVIGNSLGGMTLR